MKLYFTLECAPTPQLRPRHMRTRSGIDLTYKPETQKTREAELDWLLAKYAPEKPLTGAIALEFCAFMPVPKSASRTRRDAMLAGNIAHTAKPDLDNLCKQLKDAMTRTGFWEDDRQVVMLVCLKKYAENPCWQVSVREVGEC